MDWLQGNMTALVAMWIAAVLGFALYLVAIPSLLRTAYGRVALVFPPFFVFAALLAWTLISVFGVAKDKAVPAVIAGAMIALGWLITFLISSYREAEARDQQRRDTLYALRGEIFALVDKLDNQKIRDNAGKVQGKIANGDGVDENGAPVEYFPFSTMESEPIVFEAVSSTVPALAEDTVAAVVRFYAEYTDMRKMIEDARSDDAKALSRERRVALHKQLTNRRISTLRWGLRAYIEINKELGAKDPENVNRSGLNPEVKP